MTLDRSASLPEGPLRLKLASKRLVKALHGTALAAEIAGSRQQRISDCTLSHTREFLRIDETLALEEEARGSGDWPQVTRAMARVHDFALLPLPDSSALVGDGKWHEVIARVSRETGEAVARACKIIADGVAEGREIRSEALIEEIDQGIDSLTQMRALAEAAVKAETR